MLKRVLIMMLLAFILCQCTTLAIEFDYDYSGGWWYDDTEEIFEAYKAGADDAIAYAQNKANEYLSDLEEENQSLKEENQAMREKLDASKGEKWGFFVLGIIAVVAVFFIGKEFIY